MSDFIARLRVVATAAVTWLTGAAALIQFAAPHIAEQLPAGAAETFTAWAVRVAAWVAVAVLIIRRVTPVPEAERGVIPPPTGLVDRDGNPVPHNTPED